MNWYSGDSQIAWVCNALIEGRIITHKDEIAEAHGWRLAAVIHNLRKRYKWNITTEFDLHKVAHYKLVGKKKLELPSSFKKKISKVRNGNGKTAKLASK